LSVVIILATVFLAFTARTQPDNISRTLQGHVPRAIGRLHLQPLRDFETTNRLSLAINLPMQNQSSLDHLLQDIYDPASPYYRHYLTPGQFSAQFGPSQADYDVVVNFLKTNGLTITTTYSNRDLVDVSGDVATINRAFHVTLRVYQHPIESRTFFAPDTDPAIDAGIPISHITGLDNLVIPRPLAKIGYLGNNSSGSKAAYGTGSGPVGQYLGNDFRAAYVPGVTLDGKGQTVGLFELDAYYQSDITNYEKVAGLPFLTVTPVAVNGGVGTPGDGDGEVSLDIEMAIAMATNLSQVLVYEAPNGNGASVADLLQTIATQDKAKEISSSWLIGDNSGFETYYQQMAVQGQSFFQASGDDGAFYNGIGEWADDTNIIIVGGTTLNTTGAGGSWSSETAWNWYIDLPPNTNSTGGGTNFNGVPIPGWQQGISMTANQGSSTLRNVPDVALTADNIYVYYNQGNFPTNGFFGGTSCAAPLWAGFTALVNEQATNDGLAPVGFLNPAIYAIGKSAAYNSDFHDITDGNNTNLAVGPNKWYAVPGYDLCTGWGTPNGQNLINALASPPNPLMISPASGFSAVGFAGGPFSPNSQVYTLTNATASSTAWSFINASDWLSISPDSGILASDDSTTVTISLNPAANDLPAGTSSASIILTNSVTNIVSILSFAVQATDPLVISPAAGFSANGPIGGPFSTMSQVFTLTNIGTAALTWTTTNTSWLDISPASGALAAGAAATTTASLNTNASNLLLGTFTGQAAFTDEPGAVTQNRQFTLSIGQNIVQNGGFETGSFPPWVLNGTTMVGNSLDNGVVQATSFSHHGGTNFIHSGTFGAALGQPSILAYLSQPLATLPGQMYLLSFWLNNPSGDIPNQFQVNWNTNATTTNTVFNAVNMGTISHWTNMLFMLPATGTNTVLQFGARNDNSFFGLDDIKVWAVPLPTIRGLEITSDGGFSMTWYAQTSAVYQVQYSTNLASGDWFNLNTYTAGSPVLSVTNPIGTNGYLFYRVIGSP
jgi:subtilase family serine protease